MLHSLISMDSVPMAIAYYKEFKKQMAETGKHLKIATIYTFAANTEDDENGNKIFEHDIVLKKSPYMGEKEYFNIEMYQGSWIIANGCNWDFLCTNVKEIEVVGNIFDNPDLVGIAEDVQND